MGWVLLGLLTFSAIDATPARGQTIGPLLEAVRQGGSWVNIPIEEGQGTVETGIVPTLGLEVAGCARIWSGHSGRWTVTAADELSDTTLTAVLAPNEPLRFRHQAGPRARLSVDVRWSEARNTTLFLWVGLGGEERSTGDACVPNPPPDP